MAVAQPATSTLMSAIDHSKLHRVIATSVSASDQTIAVQDDSKTRIGTASGSDYTEFEADGTLTFVGAATVFKDENVAAYNLGLGATPPTVAAFVGGVRCYQFAGGTTGTNDELHGSLEMNHDYKQGTNIVFHVHFAPMVAVADANGGVTWALEYSWANDDSAHSVVTSSDATYNMANPTAQFTQIRSNVVTISGSGKTIGSVLAFRIFRNRVAANTYTSLVALLSVGIHYEVDTVGSRAITSK